MTVSNTTQSSLLVQAREILERVWGYDTFRPLQEQAIQAGLGQRDALVVMPTGGGKSLCYQIPPLVAGRTDLVVSPLIALMKDQVDALRQVGYPAAALHSHLSPAQRREVETGMREGAYRLVFVSPERLVSSWFLNLLRQTGIGAFAIDEAHCISQWGHDFRPEYRQLTVLRDCFPQASIHAYTATATQQVREDIVAQLQLRDPLRLVGAFDRPNLTYRILPQLDRQQQILDVLGRHRGQAAIVYCLSRRDTETTAAALGEASIRAAHYHAGLSADERRIAQDRFASEDVDVVVATIAFGMGIDRGNVRAVIHACLPRSIENYQQETGRAGRDGLPAECVLFYSLADVLRQQRMIERAAEQAEDPEVGEAHRQVQLALLRRMQQFALDTQCRHRHLTNYFGQDYTTDNCGACDICLGEVQGVEDATEIARKILSCVARLRDPYGVGHLVEVLAGADTQRIRQLGHDQLSTHGLLRELPRKTIKGFVYQLIDLDVLARSDGEMPVVTLNEASVMVLRGQRQVRLSQPRQTTTAARERMQTDKDVDHGLFEHLRGVRRTIATEQGVPAYVVLHDRTLLELARHQPATMADLQQIHGIGERKRQAYGERMLEAIREYQAQ